MSKFVVVVLFKVKPGHLEEINSLMMDNATASVRDEENCYQFDVVRRQDDENAFIFYETYKDLASFEYHLTTDHSIDFNAKLKEMGDKTERVPMRCGLISE
jgi:autoinducer 2-degrading protein